MKLISLVVPAFNEESLLEQFIKTVFALIAGLPYRFEIIFVDDGSTDDTWPVIHNLKDERIKGIRFSRNFGKEAAIHAGLTASEGDAAIVIDADLQHPPDLIPQMIRRWSESNAMIVEAEKIVRQKESLFRRLGSNLFYYLFYKLTRIRLQNASDFKLLDRQVVELFINLPERNRFFRGLTAWMGFSAEKIQYTPAQRPVESGASRWSVFQLFSLAFRSIFSYSSIPLQLVTWFGILTLCFSILLGIQTLWNKISGVAIEGFTTVILLQLIIGSILMISLGLIGEYLARIYDEIKARPVYIVSETFSTGVFASKSKTP